MSDAAIVCIVFTYLIGVAAAPIVIALLDGLEERPINPALLAGVAITWPAMMALLLVASPYFLTRAIRRKLNRR